MSSSSSTSRHPKPYKRRGNKRRKLLPSNHQVVNWLGISNPPRMRVSENNEITSFIQEIPSTTLAQTAITSAFAAYGFQFSFLDQVASIQALFDQYRIAMVEVTLRPMYNAVTMQSSGTTVPLLYTVVDYDDATAPTALGTLRAYANCIESEYETQVRRFVPHAALGAYTGSFGGFANVPAPWLDAASSTVQHYGLKIGIDPGQSGQTALQAWTITFRYLLQVRNVR
jgi:hypothetical protein